MSNTTHKNLVKHPEINSFNLNIIPHITSFILKINLNLF